MGKAKESTKLFCVGRKLLWNDPHFSSSKNLEVLSVIIRRTRSADPYPQEVQALLQKLLICLGGLT
jgi:hypothetical protein